MSPHPLRLADDRLFPVDPGLRSLARALYAEVRDLPIVSPHGHTDPAWFAKDEAFADPAQLFIVPDHYVFRMLHSQGIPLEKLGVPRPGRRSGGNRPESDLASVCGELSSLPGDTVEALARSCLQHDLRHRETSLRRDCLIGPHRLVRFEC